MIIEERMYILHAGKVPEFLNITKPQACHCS